MRKITIHLIVALCTFTLGLLLAFVWIESRRHSPLSLNEIPGSPLQSCKDNAALDLDADLSASESLSLLDYCEVASNASCYKGRIVRVKAKLSGNDHGILLYGETCSNGTHMAAIRLTGITYEEFSKLLTKACGKQCKTPLDVIIVGRFDKVVPSGQTDLNWDTTALHLELMRVEEMFQER